MKISSDRKRDLIKIGQHEASHYIAAKALGFETGSITFEVPHIHDGHYAGSIITLYNKLSTLEEIIDYIERRIIVLYAGVVGESLTHAGFDNDYALNELKNGGKSDSDKIRELMQILNNIKYPDASNEEEANRNLDKISCELWNKAIDLVLKEKEMILGLGRRIVSDIKSVGETVELTKEEINNLPAFKKRF